MAQMLSRHRRIRVALVLGLAATTPLTSLPSLAQGQQCDADWSAAIPARSPQARAGMAVAQAIRSLDEDAREAFIRREVLAGNVPAFLRRLEPVVIRGVSAQPRLTLCVMPDYLAVGNDQDYLLVPLRVGTALELGRRLGFLLPTPKMVDEIARQARVRLRPQPLPAGDAMRSSAYLIEHNALVREQRASDESPLGALTAGDKKDLVLTNRLWTRLEHVAIYGWHGLDERPIQPLSTLHGWHYVDYSHGVRFVSEHLRIDGRPADLLEALRHPGVADLLSSEGSLRDVGELVERMMAPRLASTHTRG